MKRKFSLFVTIVVCLLLVVGILSACNDDSEQDPDVHVHSMELTAAKEATCTEGGNNAYYHCSGCNKYLVISATGHKWDEGEVTTAATCTEDGVMTYACLNCGETKTETIPAGHNWNDGEVTTAATCTTDGVMTYTCLACDETRTEIIPATGHNFVDDVCLVCGEKFYTEGLEYTLSSDESYYIVTGIGTASGDIIIPDTHEGLPVKEIGSAAFMNCTELTSVEIPASVSKIQNGSYSVGETGVAINFEGAFFGCVNLESVTFAEGSELSGIGDFAFAYCSSLKSIDVPDTVTNIGEGAFFLSSTLTSIEIPAGVTSIGEGVFGTCSSLESVTFAEGSRLTSIGSGAFSGCSRLTSIEIPAGVTSIGGSAFYGCSSLTSIEIPAGVTSIGDYAFEDCSNLESVTFAEGRRKSID